MAIGFDFPHRAKRDPLWLLTVNCVNWRMCFDTDFSNQTGNTMSSNFNSFGARDTFKAAGQDVGIFRLSTLQDKGIGQIDRLPFSIRVLLESVLRNCDGTVVTEEDVHSLATWNATEPAKVEIPYKPARVVLQDFTGVPAVVDLSLIHI